MRKLWMLTLASMFVTNPAWSQGDVATVVAEWPPNATAGGSHTVTPEEASMRIGVMTLPHDFTLDCDPRVTEIHWIVDELRLGTNCTLDLSAPSISIEQSKAKNGTGYAKAKQPSWGKDGRSGREGEAGKDGGNSVALRMHVGKCARRGNLWIRNDSAHGQHGGDGGSGQRGGGSSLGNSDEPHTDGGDGGDGGKGGQGGRGGDCAFVEVQVNFDGTPAVLRQSKRNVSEYPSSRPAAASGDGGTIVIWGSSGRGGSGGKGGKAGSGGGKKRTAFFTGDRVKKGKAGEKGRDGSDGRGGIVVVTPD
jgi:hypothetical protein